MTPALLYTPLSQKLLVAISTRYVAGGSLPDWADCAAVAGVAASPRAINRAISHLAEDGFVEGVMTNEGWISLRPTSRGLSRCGRRIRALVTDDDQEDPPSASDRRPPGERVAATIDEVSQEVRVISRYAGTTWHRTREAMAPRLTAVRSTVADTWHMFTSFP